MIVFNAHHSDYSLHVSVTTYINKAGIHILCTSDTSWPQASTGEIICEITMQSITIATNSVMVVAVAKRRLKRPD